MITFKKIFRLSFGVFFGVFVTYFLVQQEILSPVLASTLCGLIASFFLLDKIKNSDVAIAMYCGSFAGMGSALTRNELFITSLIVILLILISTNFFKGFGGKLGFIAYISSIFTEILIVIIGFKNLDNFSLLKVMTNFNPISEFSSILSVVLASIFGFYLTIFFHHKLKKSAVFASAFPSFIVGLVTFFIDLPITNLIAITFFSASFVGMLVEDLLPKKHFLILIIVHILTIILFKHNLGSYGGALGTMAFLSVFVLVQLDLFIFRRIKK